GRQRPRLEPALDHHHGGHRSTRGRLLKESGMHEILVRPVLSVHLAFGLEWLPLIRGRAANVARRIARQHRATHVVLDGDAPASFGYGVSRAALRHRRRAMHSAAQNMARLYPSGSVAAIVPLPPEGHWLVA